MRRSASDLTDGLTEDSGSRTVEILKVELGRDKVDPRLDAVVEPWRKVGDTSADQTFQAGAVARGTFWEDRVLDNDGARDEQPVEPARGGSQATARRNGATQASVAHLADQALPSLQRSQSVSCASRSDRGKREGSHIEDVAVVRLWQGAGGARLVSLRGRRSDAPLCTHLPQTLGRRRI